MYVWLENVDYRGFEVCIREFLPFDGKHQDTIVVGIIKIFHWLIFNLKENVNLSKIPLQFFSNPLQLAKYIL